VIEWINILEVLAVTMAFMGCVIVLGVLVAFVRQALKGIPHLRNGTPMEKPKKEKKPMSKEAREGVTFNDIFMFMIAVPLVLLWVGFAGFVIHTGLNNSSVLENIEAYTTLIAILGGPALLIIKDALDVWKQEQAEKTAFYKVKAQAVIDFNDNVLKQAQDIESKAQEQEHKMENKK
jgi:sterol desaturase/sphingolipid hydroxylase (fatty acid hydroxylase superfamily)|tara:strand:+ start:1557 stop:2087 length:531 start_codon:yes stop_codon:yes gene_type:complete